jgi:hypothetical protein
LWRLYTVGYSSSSQPCGVGTVRIPKEDEDASGAGVNPRATLIKGRAGTLQTVHPPPEPCRNRRNQEPLTASKFTKGNYMEKSVIF